MKLGSRLLGALALAALVVVAVPGDAFAQSTGDLTLGDVQGRVADDDDGARHASPYAGQTVTVRGVVTQRTLGRSSGGQDQHGFFLQSAPGATDGDPLSSDGVFVFMGRFSSLIGGYVPRVGDEIRVSARVTEFFGLTQLTGARGLEVVARGVEVEPFAAESPQGADDAERYWERREGMQAEVAAQSRAVSGRDVFESTLDGEVWVVSPDEEILERDDPYARRVFRDPHPLDDVPERRFDNANGYRILLGSLGLKATAADNTELIAPARTFDRVTNASRGGVYYAFGKYSVQIAQQLELSPGADPATNAPPPEPVRRHEYSVANYNVENLYDFRNDPTDGCDFATDAGCPGVRPPFDYVPASEREYEDKLGEQARQIVGDLHAPELALIQEAEDQDICSVRGRELGCGGAQAGDGRPDTPQELALAIRAAGGPRYEAAADRDGADDRGIVSGFLYRSDRVELLEPRADDPVLGSDPQVDYRGAGAPHNDDVQNPKALNADLPGDVDRSTGTDGEEVYTRPPQVGRFRVWRDEVGRGQSLELSALSNHFSSGPDRRVGQRIEQARYAAAIAEARPGGRDRVLVGGDLNVFPRPDDPFAPGDAEFPSDQLAPLYETGLFNLYEVLLEESPAAAYTYVFQGQAQTLDHQFVSPDLRRELRGVRVAHINANWPAAFEDDGARGASDHDPLVARYGFSRGATPPGASR